MSDIAIPKKLPDFVYAVGKEVARSSFNDFLKNWGISEEEYEEISKFFADLGIQTYC
jgi:DNA-directed RNA polymerase subunit N (RpoN/RPB10)